MVVERQSAEPGAASTTSTEERKVDQENANHETSGETEPNIADNQESGAGLPPEDNTEYYVEQKRKFDLWKQKLFAEWEPTGISEETAVLNLAYLYWQRDQIFDKAKRAEKLKDENKQELDNNSNPTPEEEQEALPDKVLELGLRVTIEERIERDQAHFDQLIRKKIEWIVFLKASKKRIGDLSDRQSTIVSTGRRPRGVYRKSHSERQQSSSESKEFRASERIADAN
jgi:hypothetical protein